MTYRVDRHPGVTAIYYREFVKFSDPVLSRQRDVMIALNGVRTRFMSGHTLPKERKETPSRHPLFVFEDVGGLPHPLRCFCLFASPYNCSVRLSALLKKIYHTADYLGAVWTGANWLSADKNDIFYFFTCGLRLTSRSNLFEPVMTSSSLFEVRANRSAPFELSWGSSNLFELVSW